MGDPSEFPRQTSEGPLRVEEWVNFMGLVSLLAIPFAFKRSEPRWAMLAMIGMIDYVDLVRYLLGDRLA